MNRIFKSILAVALCTCTAFAQVKPVEVSTSPVALPVVPVVAGDSAIYPTDAAITPIGGVASSHQLSVFENGDPVSNFVTSVWTSTNRTHIASDATLSVGGLDLASYIYIGYNPGPTFNMTSSLWTDNGAGPGANAPLAPILGSACTTIIDQGPASGTLVECKFAPGVALPASLWTVLTADLQTAAGAGIQPGSWVFLGDAVAEVGSVQPRLLRSNNDGSTPPPWPLLSSTANGLEFYITAYGNGNTCATCVTVGDGITTGDTAGSPAGELPLPPGGCAFLDGYSDVADFLCYTATCSGQVDIEVLSAPISGDDTVLSVTDGCAGPVVACDDDSGVGLLSAVSFLTLAGDNYNIRVSAWDNGGSTSTDYELSITCTPFVCGNGSVEGPEECDDMNADPCDGCHNCQASTQANEFCECAVPAQCDSTFISDNTGIVNPATDPEACLFSAGFGHLWYSFVATYDNARIFTDSVVGGPVDSQIVVFDACGDPVSVGCSDDISGTDFLSNTGCMSGLTVGETYFFSIGSWSATDRGPYEVNIECPCSENAIGACCDINLVCTDNVNEAACTGTFAGIGSVCGATVACCFSGVCAEVAEACCAASGGTPSGPTCGGDADGDGLDTACGDNCPGVFNPAQIDADGDGLGNECDNCPNAANPGQENADGDSAGDACDGCPTDPAKLAPGLCGCNVADTNTDGDSQPDCIDNCDNDPNKLEPGLCGCGVADTNTDGDSQPDCIDNCDTDPNKLEPGLCGCGTADTDSDGDGTPNCTDNCDNDPGKINPGICGCGTPDTDSDMDGTPNCNDGCPNDPNKLLPGVCGCGTSDADTDGDGVADCNDLCPGDDDSIDLNGNGVPDCTGEPIPTVSEWGIVIMALLLLAAGKIYFGTRREVYMGA